MNKESKEIEYNQCPEFPYFGASYPDARCIDGMLYDLDACDENGLYSTGNNPSCPFCNTESFIVEMTDIDDEELASMNNDPSLTEEDKMDILRTNRTKQDVVKWVEYLKQKYLKQKWVITVASWGSMIFEGNETEAEEMRKHKANWERSVARKRLADENEIETGVINTCKNHPNFNGNDRYHCECINCKKK